MKYYFYYILLFINCKVSGQLTVNTNITPDQLVQNFLIGYGVNASNVNYSGGQFSIGTFTGGIAANLGIDQGIILSTGRVDDSASRASIYGLANLPVGTLALYYASTSLGLPGDSQLDSLFNIKTKDVAKLEFDFFPLSNTIKVEYVFCSEEYPEFVWSGWNDIFGFFISGPNPIGGFYQNNNIAIIPGTTTPISIDSLNCGYANNCNELPTNNNHCEYYVNNCGGMKIVYDGYTTVLKAWCRVEPNKTYHIKLAVADVGDDRFDSGIFLEKNSFSSNTFFDVFTSLDLPLVSDSFAVEGCNNASIIFKLIKSFTYPKTISWKIGGTAENGVDYDSIPNSITIQPGILSDTIQIIALADTITEGKEYIILTIDSLYGEQSGDIIIPIADKPNISAICVPFDSVCLGSNITLNVIADSGFAPYSYSWNNNAGTTDSVIVSPVIQTVYTVTVTDLCGSSIIDSTIISIKPAPEVTVSDTVICEGTTVTITASGASTYIWNTEATTNYITVTSDSTTEYSVTGTLSGCNDTAIATVTVKDNPVVSINDTSICKGMTVILIANGADTYLWNTGNTDDQMLVSPENTTAYSVIGIKDGCSDTAYGIITVNLIPAVSVNKDTVICNGGSALLNASGGNIYLWEPSAGLNSNTISNPVASPESTTRYMVTISDNGCSDTAGVIIFVGCVQDFYSTITPNNDGINDKWIIENIYLYHGNIIEIYNRWGILVYKGKDYKNDWDGGNLPAATYYYIIDLNNNTSLVRGIITIIR